MSRFTILLLIIVPFISTGEPLVVGYERFYSDKSISEGGELLYSELGCANCHGGKSESIVVKRTAPSFSNIANRANRDWVKEFIANPHVSKNGTTMPNLTTGLSSEEIETIVSYIGTIGKGLKLRPGRHVNAERGSALYHEKGCAACHPPTSDVRPDSISPLAISFPDLNKKTDLTALHHFLENPTRYRTDGRMPHIQLDKQEALDVAAHLLDFQHSDPREADFLAAWPKPESTTVKQGRELVEKLNCMACHGNDDHRKSIPIVDLTSDCLSTAPKKSIPYYLFSNDQTESLVKFLSKDRTKEADKTHLTMAAMNCYACHDRNRIGGPTPETNIYFNGNESLADSGKLPPPLTGIGHKLTPRWMKAVFEGTLESKVRPYVNTQMPAYTAHADTLTTLFQTTDKPDVTKSIIDNPDHLEAGRKLIGTVGGLNCITCHQWGDKPSLGIPGPDISNLDKRLQASWFHQYLLNPSEYRPATLMPPLWPQGNSMLPDVLSGNTDKQIAAIWNYIKSGTELPEGFPSSSNGDFELIPTDKPVIQRTFLENAGTKAILVGFPEKIHIAYDGTHGYPSVVWRGQFFDAYSTWFTRAAPIEKPLSEDIYLFETGVPTGRFRGYELDENGNPTFIVNRDGQTVRDHFECRSDSLIRTIRWDGSDTPKISHPQGVKISEQKTDSNELTITYSWK